MTGGVIQFPADAIKEKVYAANRSSVSAIRNEPEELSVVAYDELGNCVTRS